jgi:major outer membrane protein
MKKLVFLLLPSFLLALSMGNPGAPEIIDQGFFIPQSSSFGVKIGYQGDRIFDRLLRSQGKARGRVDHCNLQMDQGVLTLNYLDRFELYGSVGSMRSCFWLRPKTDQKRREFETHDNVTGGSGGRLLLAQWGNTGIGIDGKIQWGQPAIKWVTVDGVSSASGAHLTYREWQTSLAVFHTVGIFSPYLGAKYSSVHANVDGLSHKQYPHSHFKMVSRRRFGMALGCTLSSGKKFDLFAEVEMIDEQGISFGGNIKF